MYEPLLSSPRSNTPFGIFLVVFCFILVAAFRKFQTSDTELSVGVVDVGSLVRLTRNIGIDPAGTTGGVIAKIEGVEAEVISTDGTKIRAPLDSWEEISNIDQLVPTSSSQEANHPAGPMFPHSPPRSAPEHTWYFWTHISTDPWYLEYTCSGGPQICPGDHKCSEGYMAFHRRLGPNLRTSHKMITKNFQVSGYTSGGHDSPARIRAEFLEYTAKLLGNVAQRLILVSVTPDHTFLIEQSGKVFRIYQSWANSFDLRYWTDLSIPTSSICEPGKKVSEDLKDPIKSAELAIIGIDDHRANIENARAHYGGLKALQVDAIQELLSAISHGFSLDIMRRDSPGSIVPASRSLTEAADTKPYLGKNVINLSRLRSSSVPFDIEVSFLEDILSEKASFHEELAGPAYRSGSHSSGSPSRIIKLTP